MTSSNVVVIVDDDEAVRSSTAQLLQRIGHAVQTFASGDSFLAAELPSDIGCVLLDIRMPGTDGLAVMRELRQRESALAVIILTGHGDIALAVEAMKLGATDFLEKPSHPDSLQQAINNAFSKSSRSAESQLAANEAREKVEALSARQRDVLKGIVKGKQSKIIAHELDLSTRTVEAYRAQLLAKLGVRGTADAVRIALAAGLEEF
jgi:two-component system response regulator FixJ